MKQDAFLDFEVEYKMFDQSFNNFYYWHYLRFEISLLLFGDKSGGGITENTSIQIRDIKNILKLAMFNNTFNMKGHKDILALGYSRKIKDTNGYIDPYIEYLTNRSPYSSLLLQKYQRIYSESFSYDKNSVFIEDGILFCKIRERFLLPSEKKMVLEATDNIRNAVFDYFNIELEDEVIYKKLKKAYCIWCVFRKKYRKLLKQITPLCIVETPSYIDHAQVLNEVASELRIPTIEIEHGWIMPGNIPNNVLWNKPVASFPDYIFVYSHYQKKYIRFYQDSNHVKVVGWPYFDERIKNRKVYPDPKKKTILILGNIAYLGEQIIDFSCDLVKYMDANNLFEQYRIIYKSHPTDKCEGEKYSYLKSNSNVEIISGSSGKTVYDCIEISTIAISSVTSTLYEAKAYDLDIFVLKTNESEMMKPLVDMGYANFITKPEEVFERQTNSHLESLWPKDSLDLTIHEIEKIMEQTRVHW